MRVAKLSVTQETAKRTVNSLSREWVDFWREFDLPVGATCTPSLAFAVDSSAEVLKNSLRTGKAVGKMLQLVFSSKCFAAIQETLYRACVEATASEGIRGEPSKSEIPCSWIHSFAAAAAKPFLTSTDSAGVGATTERGGDWRCLDGMCSLPSHVVLS